MFQNLIYGVSPYTTQTKIKSTNTQKKHIIFYTCQDPPS